MSLIFTFLVKGNPHWSIINLAVGAILIVIATLSFAMLSDLSLIFDLMMKSGDLDTSIHYAAKGTTTAWVYILPVVTAAIGANIVGCMVLG